jgi:hypothetical protein
MFFPTNYLKPLSYLTGSLILGTTFFPQPSYAQSVTFICTEDSSNIPTTYAQTPDGGVEVFKWTSNFFKPPYTPKQRCEEVTQRLNSFRPDHLVTGRVNNYNVICAGTSCDQGGTNVLLTLKPNQDPAQVLAEIDANRDGAAGPSYQLSSGSTSKKSTSLKHNSDGSVSLDLNQYISTAPKVILGFSGNSSSSNSRSTNSTNHNSPLIPSTSPAPPAPASNRGNLW